MVINMDKSKICNVCGTVNEEEYSYCKNCGTPLNAQTDTRSAQYTPHPNYGAGGYAYSGMYTDYSEFAPELEGVETAKVQAYVGERKRHRFMPKFISFAKTGGKAAFNWVIAITGGLLSLPYTAAWFFYRKMYKVGLIVCAVAVAVSVCITAINFNENAAAVNKSYEKIADYSYEELADKVFSAQSDEEIFSYESSETNAKSMVVSEIFSIVEIVGVVLLAIFADYIYYKHTLGEVKKLSENGEQQLYIYSLAGKPSLTAAILIPLAFCLLIALIAFSPAFSVMLSGADAYKVLIAYIFTL